MLHTPSTHYGPAHLTIQAAIVSTGLTLTLLADSLENAANAVAATLLMAGALYAVRRVRRLWYRCHR
jgi:hypothetical protein